MDLSVFRVKKWVGGMHYRLYYFAGILPHQLCPSGAALSMELKKFHFFLCLNEFPLEILQGKQNFCLLRF